MVNAQRTVKKLRGKKRIFLTSQSPKTNKTPPLY